MSGAGGTLGVISPWLATALLNHGFGVSAMPQPSGLWVGLFSSTMGSGTEISGGGYARQPASFGAAAGSPAVIPTAADIQWPAAAADWGDVIVGGVFDDPAAGNFFGWGNLLGPDGLPVTLTVKRADIVKILAGQLVVGLT